MFETRVQRRVYKKILSLATVAQPSDTSTWKAKAEGSLVQYLPNYIEKNIISRSNKRHAG